MTAFLTRKQLKGEPAEKFTDAFETIADLLFGSHDESIIRDEFIANMRYREIQRELLKETKSAKKALEVAINIEMRTQKYMKISGTPAYTVSNQVANTSINSFQNS